MKKNVLMLSAAILVGGALFAFSNLRAQNQTAAPGAPPTTHLLPPGARMMPPHSRMVGLYRQSVRMLNMVRADLERSKEDYNGHRQSAIEACAKATQELEAVEAAMAADAAKAAAQSQTPPPGSTPAPAPSH